jgi:hypothetical protein
VPSLTPEAGDGAAENVDRIRDIPVVNEGGEPEMGEKGNLLDMGEDVFANLAEQGPQFWIAYEQYKQARGRSAGAQAVVNREVGAEDSTAEWPRPPATG